MTYGPILAGIGGPAGTRELASRRHSFVERFVIARAHNNKYIEGLEKQLMNEGPASQLAQQYVEAIESCSKSMIQKCKDEISKIGGGNGPRT